MLDASTELPSSLLNKLSTEQSAVFSALSVDESDRSLPAAKDHIKRRLIAGTPRALDVVESIMASGMPKDRLAAAGKWLDISPVVEDATRQVAVPVLPVEALRVIFEGMASMFGVQQTTNRPTKVIKKVEGATVEPTDR